MRRVLLVLLAVGAACRGEEVDLDQDGFSVEAGDCDDEDGFVHPAAVELCDGVDNDCDGHTDEDDAYDAVDWYLDGDQDGFGDAEASAVACAAPPHHVASPGDCDDQDATAYPGADELCDEVDHDCDELAVEDDAVDASTWYPDLDDDGYGDPLAPTIACVAPEDHVLDASDCDDDDDAVNPEGVEVCNGVDDDCNDAVDDAADAVTWYADEDEDGVGTGEGLLSCTGPEGWVALSGDCDDEDPLVHPFAVELCDEVNNDCDDETDEADAHDAPTWYDDTDGDGYGDPDLSAVACSQPAGFVANALDCGPGSSAVYPGADEHCEDVDYDCDEVAIEDDAVDAGTWWADVDGDGFGDPAHPTKACAMPEGYADDDDDCDDGDAAVNPDAEEVCNGVDDDCLGEADVDAVDAGSWYEDGDGDGYGAGEPVVQCEPPEGWVANADDCADDDELIHPLAVELCDEADNDCDELTDEDDAHDAPTWYDDGDGDGFGDPDVTAVACAEPEGFVANALDCGPSSDAIYPGADEHCEDVDYDCDGDSFDDDAVDAERWWADVDGDGFGDKFHTVFACTAPDGFVDRGRDCDDRDEAVNPDAEEVCNGVNDDCRDGVDVDAVDAGSWYEDGDGDGYGAGDPVVQCEPPEGWVSNADDCADGDELIHPLAVELCDEVDNDCDDETDEDDAYDAPTWYDDGDGDGFGDPDSTVVACDAPTGFVADASDCEPGSELVYPGADEYCEDVDYDCDEVTVEDDAVDAVIWFLDRDGDGFGDPVHLKRACSQPEGYVDDYFDCDDLDAAVNPDAEEVCNGIDDDCLDGADVGASDVGTWYEDGDGDGYGAGDPVIQCDAPEGWVSNADDCADGDELIHPLAVELCDEVDNDCDELTDEDDAVDAPTWYDDTDGDGFGDPDVTAVACDAPTGFVADASDCGPGSNAIHPGADEYCEDVDYDCDEVAVEDDAVDAATWWSDVDGDGFGDPAHPTKACSQPEGYADDDDDCDDGDVAVYPGAEEVCNGIDDDCLAGVDVGATDARTWYEDGDGDGYGAGDGVVQCEPPEGWVSNADDCADGDELIHPLAVELCDEVNNDCDELTDEDDAVDAPTWYDDTDGDGFGDPDVSAVACSQPDGFVADASDCGPASNAIYPGADEYCEDVDYDCDEVAVEDDAVDAETWWSDVDGDTFGDPAHTTTACELPEGYADDDDDCDDGNVAVYPGAEEVCNGIDDDCLDGVDVGAVDAGSWYEDGDGDGYGAGDPVVQCEPPEGWVSNADDCADDDELIHPLAVELCDEVNNDCDELTDEDAVDAPTWYDDTDGDGHGDPDGTEVACTQPDGFVAEPTDCDPTETAIYPGADEYCEDVDYDCDGVAVEDDAVDALEWYADIDGDGYGDEDFVTLACEAPEGWVADAGDCDEGDDTVYPGADLVDDGKDHDCDGCIDTEQGPWYADEDEDGYGDPETEFNGCPQPEGWVADDQDCDDTSDQAYPGGWEICDGLDNDCSGQVDGPDIDTTYAALYDHFEDYDTSIWQGNKWCYNNNYGSWSPLVSDSHAWFSDNGYCFPEIRTKSTWSGELAVCVTLTPYLVYDPPHKDSGWVVFSDGWINYGTDNWSGLYMQEGEIVAYDRPSRTSQSFDTYVSGDPIDLTIYSDGTGQIWSIGPNASVALDSTVASLEALRFATCDANSKDGISVDRVVVQPLPIVVD